MIKAVIFDVGGVLHNHSGHAIVKDIMKTLDIPEPVFTKAYKAVIPRFRKGQISEKEFWKEFIKLSGTKKSLPSESLFFREYKKQFKIYTDVFEIKKKLKTLKYKLAILSDTITPHENYNREQGIYDNFDEVVLSNHIALEKPYAEIYLYTLKRLDVQPFEAVFIDDLQKNVEGAQNVGMHAIRFVNAGQLKEDLITLGISL